MGKEQKSSETDGQGDAVKFSEKERKVLSQCYAILRELARKKREENKSEDSINA